MNNRFKKLIEAGEAAIGTQLRFGSPAIAELYGCAGFDFAIIDAEHSAQTPAGILAQIQGMASTPITPIVRMPRNDPDMFRVYLDMGAGGILAPFIRTAAEAEEGARACRFPPKGSRGFGPDRAARYGFDVDYLDKADDDILYMVIIETAEAVDAIDDILAVDGVDAYLVGPYDLSISMGLPRQFDHPQFTAAIDKVFAAAQKAGKPPSTSVSFADCTPQAFSDKIAQGHRVLLAGGDEWMLQTTTKNVIDSFKEAGGR